MVLGSTEMIINIVEPSMGFFIFGSKLHYILMKTILEMRFCINSKAKVSRSSDFELKSHLCMIICNFKILNSSSNNPKSIFLNYIFFSNIIRLN